MRRTSVGLVLSLAVGVTIGCKDRHPAPPPATGRVELQLTTTAGGFEYQLRDARFQIGAPANLTVEGNPADTAIDVDLLPGNYEVTLLAGWQMWRRMATGPWENVSAVLLHAPTQPFTIVAAQTTSIVFRFGVGPDFIDFGKGRGRITIDVQDHLDGGATDSGVPVDAAADAAAQADAPTDRTDASDAGCPAGFGDCDGNASNGCETALSTLTNCGACGVSCGRANATATCASGTCGIAGCNAGFGDCDGNAGNGCETALNTLTNCGACGVACSRPNGPATCASGTCELATCNAGFGDCDGNAGNGCESMLNTLANCGACGASCSRANASATCASGTCEVVTCNVGSGDCDGNAGNGCESILNTLTNCGACGVACSRANATTTCAFGVCGIVTCNAGFGDCDGNATNGCESTFNTLTNCGACGVSCSRTNAVATCATGTCGIGTCNGGFGNCDGNAANGCESALSTLTNCGACGVSCSRANASATCGSGTCQLASCNAGFGNCDGNAANGCETALVTNTNCGGCGVACSRANASSTCSTGTCNLAACNAGFDNCDGNATNGCEVNHANVVSSCASAVSIATFDGDRACGFICGGNTDFDLFATRTGTTSAFFRARVREDSDCPTSIEHQVRLIVPAGADYDLYVYSVGCGTLRGSSTNGAGTMETVTISAGDDSGTDDSFDYIVEVRYFSGASCSSWTLQMYGHDC